MPGGWHVAETQSVERLLASLPPAERARRYREIARDVFQRAANTQDDTMRAGYLSLASGWQVLALEIEHSLGFDDPRVRPRRAVRAGASSR